MIKIEITDPQNLDSRILEETAAYLLSFSRKVEKDINPELKKKLKEETEVYFNTVREEILEFEKLKENINGFKDSDEIIPEALIPIEHTKESPTFNPFAAKEDKPFHAPSEIDARGIPWDARIHAKTKTKNIDGSWRCLRNVTLKNIKIIEDELLNNNALQLLSPNTPNPNMTPSVSVVPTWVPPAPVAPLVPPSPVADSEITFQTVMTKITEGMVSGKITREDVFNILTKNGIVALPVLASRPNDIPAINAALDEILK